MSQGVNFLILLSALTFFLYRPLTELMKERKRRIEKGLADAEEAGRKLGEIEKIKTEKLAEAQSEALKFMEVSEREAAKRSKAVLSEADKKADEILNEASEIAEKKKLEELENLKREASSLIREAIARTVELDPKAVDERLISKALDKLSINAV